MYVMCLYVLMCVCVCYFACLSFCLSVSESNCCYLGVWAGHSLGTHCAAIRSSMVRRGRKLADTFAASADLGKIGLPNYCRRLHISAAAASAWNASCLTQTLVLLSVGSEQLRRLSAGIREWSSFVCL